MNASGAGPWAWKSNNGQSWLVLLAWVLLWSMLLTGLHLSPAEAAACGGNGQRACCTVERGFEACDPGLVEVPGCDAGSTDACLCGKILGVPVFATDHCVAPTPCGGEGQRACCIDLEGVACKGGLTQVAGCVGNCLCGGINPGGRLSSITSCIKATACGGVGQRACCAFEPGHTCAAGLSEIPGCTGDCTCGGELNVPLASSSGTCAKLPFAKIDEPGTNETSAVSPSQDDPLRGYADIHVHMFANLGHGGGVMVGEPYDAQGGINQALKQDYGTDLDLVQKDGSELHNPEGKLPPVCPSFLPNCGSKLFHGDHTPLDDPVGFGTEDRPGSNLGVPLFNGWPTWTTTVHQQVYYKWLQRAWQGGLRLMVMQAVTNEALCLSNKHLRNTDCTISMLPPDRLDELDKYDDRFQLKAGETAPPLPLPPVEAQLQAAYRFEDFLDQQSGGPGQGWFRIVTTPADAQAVIRAGKLAVVLGIEVDKLFGCSLNGPCTDDSVRTAVDKYYDKGVRAVFPVHNFDNGFGAAATWQDAIGVGQGAAVGTWWQTVDCGKAGYGFWLDTLTMQALYVIGFGGNPANVPIYPAGVPSCSRNGLAPLSGTLFDALRDKGMIIDIDHMSSKSIDNTLSWAEQQGYPVVASHTLYFDRYQQFYSGNAGRHERMRTRAQLDRIRKLGGMIAVMLKDDVQDTDKKDLKVDVTYQPSGVPDDCRHSSKTWAQAYWYAVDVMGGPVAFGSDFNGVAGHVGPRFGDHACGNNTTEQLTQVQSNHRVTYPFTIAGFGTFDRQVTGSKAFDFNVDGLAHIGLLPDLVADLKVIGLSDAALAPLFHSAEAYISVWQKCLDSGASGP